MDDQDDNETSAMEKAFDEAGRGFELFGNPLKDYSPSRMLAAQNMGLRYPFIGEKAAEIFEETGMYPGGLEDCIIVLWLCSLPDKSKKEDWNPDRAASKSSLAKLVATGWAAKQGFINVSSPQFAEAFAVFVAIVTGQEASKFRVTSGEQTSPEIEPGKL